MDSNLVEKNHNKANNQLINIDCKKSKIKKEIYILYDLYLKIIRSNLQNYVGEAIKSLVEISDKGRSVKHRKTKLFIRNDLKSLINKIKPFLTIEQLSIKKESKISNRIKNNRDFKSNNNFKEEIYTIKNFENIDTSSSTNYRNFYYENLINGDKSNNINIDNDVLKNKHFGNYKHDVSFGCINSEILLKDIYDDKLSLNMNQSNNSKYFIPIEFKDIISWIDTLEYSLNIYLKDLSIEINNELFKKNIFKRCLNNDLLIYIFDNHLLFSNPSPFILKFDPSLNQYINFDMNFSENKLPKIHLININNAELEFININLSMLKNKLLEIKSNIYLLIKKENYWYDKLKINSNIESTINKF